MDNLCKRCYHNYVCEQYNENRDLTRTKCDYKNSHFVDATDVIPVRHGRWIERKSFHAEGGISATCSACQIDVQYLGNPLKYCPNCGANMDLEG